MVRISLDIPENTYEKLMSLCDHYEKDVNEIINEIIYAISLKNNSITRISEEYEAEGNLTRLLLHILGAGILSTDSLFNMILEEMDAKGHFVQDDLQIDIYPMQIWINFARLSGSDLLVDRFSILLESGIWSINATSYIDEDKVDDNVLDALNNIILNEEAVRELLPEEYFGDIYGIEDWKIVCEENYMIFTGESEGDLVNIKAISILFQKIYEAARVKVNRSLDQ